MTALHLEKKHFGDAVLLGDLNLDNFEKILDELNLEYKIPPAGILVRYNDGTVGVTIPIIRRKDGNVDWVQETTKSTTISSWAENHK